MLKPIFLARQRMFVCFVLLLQNERKYNKFILLPDVRIFRYDTENPFFIYSSRFIHLHILSYFETHRQQLKVHIASSSWKCNHVAYSELRLLFLWVNVKLKFVILHWNVPISCCFCYFCQNEDDASDAISLLWLLLTVTVILVFVFISSTDFFAVNNNGSAFSWA